MASTNCHIHSLNVFLVVWNSIAICGSVPYIFKKANGNNKCTGVPPSSSSPSRLIFLQTDATITGVTPKKLTNCRWDKNLLWWRAFFTYSLIWGATRSAMVNLLIVCSCDVLLLWADHRWSARRKPPKWFGNVWPWQPNLPVPVSPAKSTCLL